MDAIEPGDVTERQLPFHPVGEDEYDHVEAEAREVLEEDWVASATQERPSLGEEGIVVFIADDQVLVEVGIFTVGPRDA